MTDRHISQIEPKNEAPHSGKADFGAYHAGNHDAGQAIRQMEAHNLAGAAAHLQPLELGNMMGGGDRGGDRNNTPPGTANDRQDKYGSGDRNNTPSGTQGRDGNEAPNQNRMNPTFDNPHPDQNQQPDKSGRELMNQGRPESPTSSAGPSPEGRGPGSKAEGSDPKAGNNDTDAQEQNKDKASSTPNDRQDKYGKYAENGIDNDKEKSKYSEDGIDKDRESGDQADKNTAIPDISKSIEDYINQLKKNLPQPRPSDSSDETAVA